MPITDIAEWLGSRVGNLFLRNSLKAQPVVPYQVEVSNCRHRVCTPNAHFNL
jgi:hypothetical protein